MLQSSLGDYAALYLSGNTAPECPGLYSKDAHENSSKGKTKCHGSPSSLGFQFRVLREGACRAHGEPNCRDHPWPEKHKDCVPMAAAQMDFPLSQRPFSPLAALSVSPKRLICSMKHFQSQALHVGMKGKREEFPREKQFTLPFSSSLPPCLGTPVCKQGPRFSSLQY